MKSLLRIPLFLYVLAKNKILGRSGFEKYPYEEIEEREKKSKHRQTLQFLLGEIYHRYISLRERDRIWTYKIEQEKDKHSILLDLIRHSKSIIFYLILAIIISSFLDWLFFYLESID